MSTHAGGYEYIGDMESVEETPGGVLLRGDGVLASVTMPAEGVVRVRIARGEEFGPDHSWAVVADPQPPAFEIEETDAAVTLTSEHVTAAIERRPFRAVFSCGGDVVNEDLPGRAVGWRGDRVRCSKAMPEDEHYYGFGEKLMPLDRRNCKMTMWNTDAGLHKPGSDPLYQAIPFYIGHRAGRSYGIFFDNTWKSQFNMGGAALRHATFQAEGGDMNYYFIAGPDMKTVVRRYTALTGRHPLPALWTLGHHQCRWSYKTDERVRRIAAGFRERDIPCDAMWLDIHYMRGYRVFTWHPKRFPDPRGLIEDLARDGFKTVVIIDPGVKKDPGYFVFDHGVEKDYFLRRTDGTLFTGYVWPGATVFPDFNREEVRGWWAGLHTELMDQGVAGVWNDMNEPSINIQPHRRVNADNVMHHDTPAPTPHLKNRNVYGLGEAMATHEAQRRARPDRRPFVLTRAGYAGIQRYAAVWAGDNTSNWSHLRFSLPELMGMGLSGVPFVGVDIGGFAGNCSPELYARWIQAGALSPFCRTHTMLMTRSQEPWSFGRRVTDISRRYIRLRYRLLPFLYNLFREAEQIGLPPMRPLILEYPDDPECETLDDQFLLGRDLLAAPVMGKGARSREVYLPDGQWLDYWTGERRTGPSRFIMDTPLETMPLFVRAGAIIPCAEPAAHTAAISRDTLILDIFTLPGRHEMAHYEDDGGSTAYRDGAFSETTFAFKQSDGGIEFTAGERTGDYAPPRNSLLLRFMGVDAGPQAVEHNGAALERAPVNSGGAWDYDVGARILECRIPDNGAPATLKIIFS